MMIHFLGIISLVGYLLNLIGLYFSSRFLNLFAFRKLGFNLSLALNLIFILLALGSNYSSRMVTSGDENYFFESHPAIILLLVSFAFYVSLNFYNLSSILLKKIFVLVSFTLLSIGSLLLHKQGISQVYALSPLLIFHIFVSLISQVFLLLVFIFSFLIVVIEKGLRKKTLPTEISSYPPLVPTRKIWVKALYLGIISFFLAILTGLIQAGGVTFSYKIILSFLCFMGLSLALFAYNSTRISIVRITFVLGVYIFVIFALQVLIRTKIITL